MRLEFDRLPAETQMNILNDISKETYNNMSSGEQEQWTECRG